jgi:hypothetical protein
MRRRSGPAHRNRLLARPELEVLEDRLPVSESLGTLLAVATLAGGAETLLALAPSAEWLAPRAEVAESDPRASAAGPDGLTRTESLSVLDA